MARHGSRAAGMAHAYHVPTHTLRHASRLTRTHTHDQPRDTATNSQLARYSRTRTSLYVA